MNNKYPILCRNVQRIVETFLFLDVIFIFIAGNPKTYYYLGVDNLVIGNSRILTKDYEIDFGFKLHSRIQTLLFGLYTHLRWCS